MKKIILVLMLIVFIMGCAEETEEQITCKEYCEQQPHIMCVGDWEITGEYPDCECKFVCETEEVVVCTNYDGNQKECSSHSECKWTSGENICEPIGQVEVEDEEVEDDEGDEDDPMAGFVSKLEKDLPNTPSNEICKKLPLTKGLGPGNRYYCFAVVNNNAEFCELLESDNEEDIKGKDGKNLCLAHVKKDDSYCKKISDKEGKKDCYFGLSLISGDIDVCDEINYDRNERQLCYWSFANALYWEDKSDKITTEHCNKLPAGSEDRNTCLAFKERDVSLCRNNVNCLTCFEQPMSFCTGKGSVLKDCIRDRAMSSKDLSICETLTGEKRDDCIGDFAGHISLDISTCDKITSDFARNTCYKDVAIQSSTVWLTGLRDD